MGRQKSITIEIPNPCQQDWERMTPSGQGRFCGQCGNTVIDFTAWSDAQLYQFLAGNKDHICGRYLSTQMGRSIALPPQPHSRLYRIAVTLGLTLIFARQEDVKAQNRTPVVVDSPVRQSTQQLRDLVTKAGVIKGLVIDNTKEPVANASVRIMQGAVLKSSALTDYDGNYSVAPLVPGLYDVEFTAMPYKSFSAIGFVVSPDTSSILNCILIPDRSKPKLISVKMGKMAIGGRDNNVLRPRKTSKVKKLR